MSDHPLVTSRIKSPAGSLEQLAVQHARLVDLLKDMDGSLNDTWRYESEGAQYAGYAVVWAFTVMLTDIIRVTWSQANPTVALLFIAQDKLLEQASKVTKLFGMKAPATKEQLLKTVDPDFKKIVDFSADVRMAQKFLKDLGMKAPEKATLMLDLATAVSDDAALIMQATRTGQQVQANSNHSRSLIQHFILKSKLRLAGIEQEYTRLFLLGEYRSKIA